MFHAEEHTFEIGVDDRVPIGLGEVGQRAEGDGHAVRAHARVVEGDVDAAEQLQCLRHHRGHVGFVAHVAADVCGLAAARLDLGHGLLRCGDAPGRRDEDPRTLPGKSERGRSAYAGRSPGDDRSLASNTCRHDPYSPSRS